MSTDRRTQNMAMRSLSFTLMELLVVIAIVAVLASLLLPALQEARSKANRATCASRHRQLLIALNLYANDFDDYLPHQIKDGSPPNVMTWRLDQWGFPAHEPVGLGLLYSCGYLNSYHMVHCTDLELLDMVPNRSRRGWDARNSQDLWHKWCGSTIQFYHDRSLFQTGHTSGGRVGASYFSGPNAMPQITACMTYLLPSPSGYVNNPYSSWDGEVGGYVHGQDGINVGFVDGSTTFYTADELTGEMNLAPWEHVFTNRVSGQDFWLDWNP